MEYLLNVIVSAVCSVNRNFQYHVMPYLKELDTFPMYIDTDIAGNNY